ncbi:hypothetical protein, partial [Bacteroides gallinaceum]|uniref:hypothetical protein n=1 Tax=Bacteroides gallinaceum TaxID=1462571 RepID=UPI001956F2CD
IFLITEAKMPQKLIPNHRTINSKQLLNRFFCYAQVINRLFITVDNLCIALWRAKVSVDFV